MSKWNKKIRIKHLLNEKEDLESVRITMGKVANILSEHKEFPKHLINKMKNIPQGDEFFVPIDYANKLLNQMYDNADYFGVWIE